MKYMTKEWYRTMQKTDLHLLLKISKEAESFSEEYFRKLYAREERAWVKLQQEVAEVPFEDIYPEEFDIAPEEDIPIDPDELQQIKQSYLEERERALVEYENRPPFDAELEKESFRRSFEDNIAYLQEILPEEILDQVADIRVLALNRASSEVKKAIRAFSRANKKLVESTIRAYEREFARTFRNSPPPFLDAFELHDCQVLEVREEGGDLILTLDNSGGFTATQQVIFRDAEVLMQDAPLEGAWWAYDEIYKAEGGFEIHVLLEDGELIDFIVRTRDVEVM